MRMALLGVLCFSALLLGSSFAVAQVDQPVIVDGELVFPPDAVIPRYLTDTERRWLDENPGGPAVPRVATAAPTGPLHCVAEYEPMDGILLNWRSYTTIIAEMARLITTTGNANAYIVVANAATQSSATTTLSGNGTNMSRVKFLIAASDTVWIRDYGPRYVYQGDCRAIVDHRYNRPRPNDDVIPTAFANYKKHGYYEMQTLYSPNELIHGGGNFHLSANTQSFATRLTVNENPLLTEPQITNIWNTYQGLNHMFFNPFPTSVDATQHIDMWMQVCGDQKVMISDWPNNPGSTQDVICDNAAVTMAGMGYTVTRIPAFSVSGVHYTYTNVVICNNLILVPSYTNATVQPFNAAAVTAWQTAMPGYTVSTINCQAMITAAGVMHCIAMHVPQHRGGANPTVYLKTPRTAQTLPAPGNSVAINWITDDDNAVSNVDILLSTTGGNSYDTVIASAIADTGSYNWVVPNLCTNAARIRVVARDANGNTGHDSSIGNLVITGTVGPVGDLNCDCARDLGDVSPFVLALLDPTTYAATYPGCPINNADINGDGQRDGRDIARLVDGLLP